MVVVSGFAAINAAEHAAGSGAAEQGATLEAQEARVIAAYEAALRAVQGGDAGGAEVS